MRKVLITGTAGFIGFHLAMARNSKLEPELRALRVRVLDASGTPNPDSSLTFPDRTASAISSATGVRAAA